MKRILVTGSRDWTSYHVIRRALTDHGPGLVVHGAARGADTIADTIAGSLGWPTEPHPAEWDRYATGAAGPIRNSAMVGLGADVCLAFPLGRSSGTYDCARKAARAGIPVVLYLGCPECLGVGEVRRRNGTENCFVCDGHGYTSPPSIFRPEKR